MDRRTIIANVRKSSADLSAAEVESLMETAQAEKVSGRGAKQIREWTLAEMQDVLNEKKREKDVRMKEAADLDSVRTRLKQAADNFGQARSFLQKTLIPDTPWSLEEHIRSRGAIERSIAS